MWCRHAVQKQFGGALMTCRQTALEDCWGRGDIIELQGQRCIGALSLQESLTPDIVPSLGWQMCLRWAVHSGPLQIGGPSIGGGLGAMVEPTACMVPQLGKGDDCHIATAFTAVGSRASL